MVPLGVAIDRSEHCTGAGPRPTPASASGSSRASSPGHGRTVRHLLAITGHSALLEHGPTLGRSIRHRIPYPDPLNHGQVELLHRIRGGQTDQRMRRAIHLTISGLAAGLRKIG